MQLELWKSLYFSLMNNNKEKQNVCVLGKN